MKYAAVTVILAAALASGAHAAPFVPASGTQIVETLRGGRVQQGQEQAQARELQRLRRDLAAAPRDVALATALARRYIEMSRRDADPRFNGYAQAALAPWWNEPSAPTEVLLLRATLLQSTHQFDHALRDLATIIQREPGNVQAWLTRATVQTVRADYAGARSSCARLAALAPTIVTATCAANVGAMTGQLAQSRSLLQTAFGRESGREPEIDAWVRTVLAELAERAGDRRAAQTWYEAALGAQGAGADSYLLGAYADFLLDAGMAKQVLTLLERHQAIDGLLLRYAIALKQLDRRTELAQVSAELDARFHAGERRGDGLHQREQALYELRLRGNPQRALALAQQNWAVQKEAADARLLLEAAAAARNKAAAKPVLDWMRAAGVQDVRLARAAQPLGKI